MCVWWGRPSEIPAHGRLRQNDYQESEASLVDLVCFGTNRILTEQTGELEFRSPVLTKMQVGVVALLSSQHLGNFLRRKLARNIWQNW